MIDLLNLRLGPATNSSSMHSLIFLPEGRAVQDDFTPGEYGWDRFTLVSRQAKAGRGKNFRGELHEDDDSWLDVVKKLRKEKSWLRLGVDTTLARKYAKEIADSGVPEYMFRTEEGKFSAYIDAVNETMGPSSFCPKGKMSELDLSYDGKISAKSITEIFAKF